jgi:hypothetical protein
MRPAQAKTVWATLLMATMAMSSAAFGSVTLNAGNDIQSAINSNPEGTTFILNAGVYRLTAGLTPKSNDVFSGQSGAVLNGSRLLTSWTQSGSTWVTQTPTQHFASTSLRCTPISYAGCHYDDAVFYDDQPLFRVMSTGELHSGTVYVDFFTDHVYLADNPQGHKVEMATSPRAFISARTGVVNVTIQGLVVEKFANAGGEGALEAGSTWTILNNEIRFNHGIGLTDGYVVRGNFVHHNGELGIGGGSGSNGMLVENNEIAFNNTASFDWYMEGGATKWFNTTNLILRGNYVHDNTGPGLWTDGDNIHTIYENNHTKNNAGPGIFHEISFDAIIRNNVVEYDSLGAAGSSLWWGAGIFLNSSSEVEIYGNRVSYCLHGIGGSSTDHGNSPINGRRYYIQNVNVHDNIITLNSGIAAGFVRDSTVVPPDIFTSWNNHFDYNTYYLGNLSGMNFDWADGDRTRNEWQSYGNDIHGTFLSIGAGLTPTTTVSIASPANGAAVSGAVTVSANASDTSGVTRVEFYVDGALRATNQAFPWIFSWDSSQAAAGSHTLSVKAYGATGGTATAQITVTVAAPADTTAPTANINSPVSNSTVSGTVTIIATATDNVGVTRVEFSVDGNLTATKTSAPWTFSWNSTQAFTGQHTLAVKAYDAAGNNGGSSITVFVATPADTVAPTASIFSPGNNAVVSGIVTVSATANDNVGVTRVEFSVDGDLTATKTSAPWNFSWNATQAAAGPHTLGVVAYDAAGNQGGSSITVTIAAASDTTLPTVSITFPFNNSTVSGSVAVTANASDNVGVTRVEFYVDATLTGTRTAAPWSFVWDTTKTAAGSHTLTVVAYDAAGNHDAAVIAVTVAGATNSTTPAVSFGFPTDNAIVSGVVTVSALANDLVTQVLFYVDGRLAGTSTAAPWNFTWDTTSVAAGSHTLQLVAFDGAGNHDRATVWVTVTR